MYQDQKIALVIPAYRERQHIGGVVSSIPGVVDAIYVVDDASDDGTAEAAFVAGDSRVQVIVHEKNRGAGAARVTGHKAALAGGADVVVVMDGDGQMDPAYLESLLVPVCEEGYGFAKANRFFAADSFAGMPRHRVFGNIALTFMTKAASGYWDMVDPQNGYTAIRADVLRRLKLDSLDCGYGYENDLLVWLNVLDVPTVDVPIPARYGSETSGLRLRRDCPRLAWTLTRGFWRRMVFKYVLWSFSPVALLFFAALAMFALTGVDFVGALALYNPHRALPTATVFSVGVPPILGFFLLVQSLMLDIAATPALGRAPARSPMPVPNERIGIGGR